VSVPAGIGPLQEIPAEAAEVFGDGLELAAEFARLLATVAVERGLIGPREAPRLWSRHLLNSAALASWIPVGVDALDLGSGAGLPGIPLAIARPDLHMTLVEPMARRAIFLKETVAALGLDVAIRRARGEELEPASADVVVARAVAPLARLIPLALPLLRENGRLVALKGSNAEGELSAAAAVLAAWPRARASVVRATTGAETATAVMIGLDDTLPDSGGSPR
jgi:16S rRNA (guanine527-N7)-methyltransferase